MDTVFVNPLYSVDIHFNDKNIIFKEYTEMRMKEAIESGIEHSPESYEKVRLRIVMDNQDYSDVILGYKDCCIYEFKMCDKERYTAIYKPLHIYKLDHNTISKMKLLGVKVLTVEEMQRIIKIKNLQLIF